MRITGLLLFLVWATTEILPAEYSCKNIADFNFGNSILTMGGTGLTIRQEYSLFNSPAHKERFAFRNGIALQWLVPEEHNPQRPDFRITIDRDQLVHPTGSSGVKILIVQMDHLTGTGSFQYLAAYDCRERQLHKLLDVSGEGVKFLSASNDRIQLTLFLWSDADAHCCPSKKADVMFQWSPKRQAYIGPTRGAIQPNN